MDGRSPAEGEGRVVGGQAGDLARPDGHQDDEDGDDQLQQDGPLVPPGAQGALDKQGAQLPEIQCPALQPMHVLRV